MRIVVFILLFLLAYNRAVQQGNAQQWIQNYNMFRSKAQHSQNKSRNNNENYNEIYGQIFNIRNNKEEESTSGTSSWNWYKLPQEDISKSQTCETSKPEEGTKMIETAGHEMAETIQYKLPQEDISKFQTCETSKPEEGTEMMETEGHETAETIPENPITVMTDTSESNSEPASIDKMENGSKEHCRSPSKPDSSPIQVYNKTSSPHSESDVENYEERQRAPQISKFENDKNISHFMDVMTVKSSRFTVYFHGEKMLCLTRDKGKYIVLRELLFLFFRKEISLVKSLINELRITKIHLSGKEKKGVCRYLSEKGVYSHSSTTTVGIIHVEHANRLYHKVFPERKCDVCVKLCNAKGSTPSPETRTVIEIDSDTEDAGLMPTVKLENEDSHTKEMLTDSRNDETPQVLTEENYDSDDTLPYQDTDTLEKSMQGPGKDGLENDFEDGEIILSGGIMEQDGNLIRFVKNGQNNFLPVKDLKKFGVEVIAKTISLKNLLVRQANCLESSYLTRLINGHEQVMQGDSLVDVEILNHIYSVAESCQEKDGLDMKDKFLNKKRRTTLDKEMDNSCNQNKDNAQGVHDLEVMQEQNGANGQKYGAMIEKMRKILKGTLDKQIRGQHANKSKDENG